MTRAPVDRDYPPAPSRSRSSAAWSWSPPSSPKTTPCAAPWAPPLTGTCVWSDGKFTGTAVSGQPRFYSTYSFTYAGASGTRTVTQPTVTRDGNTMAITTRPALVVT